MKVTTEPQRQGGQNPKEVDQPLTMPRGSWTESGKFFRAAMHRSREQAFVAHQRPVHGRLDVEVNADRIRFAACLLELFLLCNTRSQRMRTVFDCFCGLGGFSIGAELAGFEVVGGVDADPDAIEMYSRIFPDTCALKHDLLAEQPKAILHRAGIARGDVDVLIGGPPCQPYSVNNHQRSTTDIRCDLVSSYLQFVSVLQPAWLVMENVPGFASIDDGQFLRSLIQSLRSRTYNVESFFVNAIRFGVPQSRRRLIILASRSPAKLACAQKELAANCAKPVTVGAALGDLPETPSTSAIYCTPANNQFRKKMRERAPSTVHSHVAPQLGPKNLRRMSYVPPGGSWRDIPRRLLPAGMKRARIADHTTRYGRLHRQKPAYTLLTKCDPHWGCFVHPVQDRIITVREAARLQSIPDRVCFGRQLTVNYRLVGNAVPPLLAQGTLELLL